jgi:hypothetical protein
VLVLVVVLSLPNEALAKLGARPVGLLRHNESRFSCNNFVRSVSRWDIQLLEDEHEQEHEHGFSISEFRLNRQGLLFYLFLSPDPPFLEQFFWDLFQEPRGALDAVVCRRIRPKRGVGEIKLVLGSCGCDVEQAALLLDSNRRLE